MLTRISNLSHFCIHVLIIKERLHVVGILTQLTTRINLTLIQVGFRSYDLHSLGQVTYLLGDMLRLKLILK